MWDEGIPVWDSYVHHRQVALTQEAAELLIAFSRPRARAAGTPDLGGRVAPERRQAIVEQLCTEGILIDDEQYDRELDLLTSWRSWGSSARYFHFATRSLRSTAVLDDADHNAQLRMKSEMGAPPPPQVQRRDGVDYLPLPMAGRPGMDSPRFWDVLFRRKSRREFDTDLSVPLVMLSDLLWSTCRFTRTQPSRVGLNYFRTSASGGARHPLDVYVRVSRVPGLHESGVYHYDPLRHELGQVADCSQSQLVEMAGGQQFVADSAVQLMLVATRSRTEWKYETARAYRTLLIDVGHVSQSVYLATDALGLGCTYVGLVCDELIEQVLGLNSYEELPMGMLAIGRVGEQW